MESFVLFNLLTCALLAPLAPLVLLFALLTVPCSRRLLPSLSFLATRMLPACRPSRPQLHQRFGRCKHAGVGMPLRWLLGLVPVELFGGQPGM